MASNPATCAIGVMAKAPQPGRSKTRLCPPLRPEQAAELSVAFLRDTTRNVVEAARTAPIAPFAAFAPAGAEAAVAAIVAPGTTLVLADGTGPAPEGVEAFGRCLFDALVGMLRHGHAAACLLSSDVPNLPTRLLVEAAERLLAPGDTAVLGASEDGGYYLLGLKTPHARMFADIAWSTDGVAEATRTRARELGLAIVELEPWYDVDDASSLALLLADRSGSRAPATRAALTRLGLPSPELPGEGAPLEHSTLQGAVPATEGRR